MFHKKLILAVLSASVFASNLLATENKSNVSKASDVSAVKNKSEYFRVLESTLKNNKDIISAQKTLLASHENYVISAANLRPQAQATASAKAENKDSWNSDIKKSFNNSTSTEKGYGISISQNLFNGLADVAALKETDLNIKAQWSEYEAAKQNVLREVSELYFNVIAKKQEIAHLKSLLEARQSLVELASEMFSTGSVKYLDVAQAQSDCATTEGRLATSEAELESLKAQFEEKTGMPMPANLSVPEKIFDTSLTVEKAKDIALKYNPEIIAATDRVAAAKESIKQPNPGFRPRLDLTAGFEQGLNKSKQNHRSESVGLTLTVPIFDGGVGRAKKRQAIETANKYAVDKEKLMQQKTRDITAIFAAIEAAHKNMICAQKAVEASELALHDVEEEFKAGLKITKDILDAQQTLYEAKFIATQAENRYFVSLCTANALLGRLNARYLKIKDSDFDYKEHFEETRMKF